jgi:hypothetical protein
MKEVIGWFQCRTNPVLSYNTSRPVILDGICFRWRIFVKHIVLACATGKILLPVMVLPGECRNNQMITGKFCLTTTTGYSYY